MISRPEAARRVGAALLHTGEVAGSKRAAPIGRKVRRCGPFDLDVVDARRAALRGEPFPLRGEPFPYTGAAARSCATTPSAVV